MVPRENRRKVSKKLFWRFFDDFLTFFGLRENCQKRRTTFWHFLTIFDVFWLSAGPFGNPLMEVPHTGDLMFRALNRYTKSPLQDSVIIFSTPGMGGNLRFTAQIPEFSANVSSPQGGKSTDFSAGKCHLLYFCSGSRVSEISSRAFPELPQTPSVRLGPFFFSRKWPSHWPTRGLVMKFPAVPRVLPLIYWHTDIGG